MNEFFQEDLVSSDRILYTPSDWAKSNLIYLQETGSLKALHPHTSSRNHLSSFLFFIVTDGEGTLTYQQREYLLHTGDCVFLDCRTPYAHSCQDSLWSLSWVHFYGSNMNGIYEKFYQRCGSPVFHTAKLSQYAGLLAELYRVAADTSYIRDMKIYESLTALLSMLMEDSWCIERKPAGAQKRSLQDVKDYLDCHFLEKISLDALAGQFYINKYYLSRSFKEQYGTTLIHYVLRLRINRAKQLLRFSDMTVSEVGSKCGMPDANYFARIFQKIEGCSPSVFRSEWRK